MVAHLKGFLQPLQVPRIKIRALAANFYIGAHVAQVGEEGEVDHSDALTLVKQNKATIIGDAPARTIAARDLQDPPPLRRGV
jgi:hypothetical protein